MRSIPKTELSPDNGAIIDTKWKVGPLSYHACAAGPEHQKPVDGNLKLPEVIIYDHVGFRGAYARTNLSFHFLGDFWNDRSAHNRGQRRLAFLPRRILQGDHWDLGPDSTNASSPKRDRTTW